MFVSLVCPYYFPITSFPIIDLPMNIFPLSFLYVPIISHYITSLVVSLMFQLLGPPALCRWEVFHRIGPRTRAGTADCFGSALPQRGGAGWVFPMLSGGFMFY